MWPQPGERNFVRSIWAEIVTTTGAKRGGTMQSSSELTLWSMPDILPDIVVARKSFIIVNLYGNNLYLARCQVGESTSKNDIVVFYRFEKKQTT